MEEEFRVLQQGKGLLGLTSAQKRVGRSCNSHLSKSFCTGRRFARWLYFPKMSASTFLRHSRREGQSALPSATRRNFLQVRPQCGELGKCRHQAKCFRAAGSSLCAVEATPAHSNGDRSHPPRECIGNRNCPARCRSSLNLSQTPSGLPAYG